MMNQKTLGHVGFLRENGMVMFPGFKWDVAKPNSVNENGVGCKTLLLLNNNILKYTSLHLDLKISINT